MTEKTEKGEQQDDGSSVRVALRIRPQLAREKIDMCQVCTSVLPGEQQVVIGKDKAFTFDYTFDMQTTQEEIYDSCVRKLIDGCFDGYNATVFAYGQTGSGKTYSMGTGFDLNISQEEVGIIPRSVDHLFKGIDDCRKQAKEKNEPLPDFKVTAQFLELYNEEILDLLDTTRDPESRGRKSHIKIHEDAGGGIYVVGVTTRPVITPQDTMQCLKNGALSRATASTNMNVQSSRSHAIFTLHIKQHRLVRDETLDEDGKETDSTQDLNEFETLTAKFHFVDLAGSERLKRTGATGDRAKEGISINCGLLALGNVISALGDKAKKGHHVPYRDSKLTRLLQDSLGGNSRTLMIACISPSDRDFIETLNTLKYANRARNIKNKVIANQDKTSKQLAALRAEIAQLQQELLDYKTGKRNVDSDGVESINDMFHENTMLQTENDKLRQRIKALNEAVESLTTRNTQLLVEKESLGILNIADDSRAEEVTKLIEGYVKELETLRGKLAESEALCDTLKRRHTPSRMTMTPMSPVHMSSSFNLDSSMSIDNSLAAILEEAKKDINHLRKQKRSKSRRQSHSSDKENMSGDDEKDQNEAEVNPQEEVQEEENKEKEEKDLDVDEEDIENGDVPEDLEEEDLEEFDNSTDDDDDDEESDEEDKDSDNIHEDLAELTCEISIKQKLVEELEHSQKRLQSMKHQYEEKVLQLMEKIKHTEMERDKVLANINQVETISSDKVKKVKQEFEKKLSCLQTDLKKMQAAKKEHAKLVKNQSHYEKQLKTLQHELAEMKKTKVKLMKQVKDESDKGKQSEMRRNREIAQLRKEQLRKENRIRNLEKESKQRDLVLKRKQEEVEALRKKSKPMSAKAAGRVGKYDRPTTIPLAPMLSRRRKRTEFSAKVAKQKWDAIDRSVVAVVNKKQTIAYMERDMDVWLKQREKLCKKIEKYTKRRDAAIANNKDADDVKNLSDTVDTLKLQVQQAQENIAECQTNIMQMEESKDEGEGLDVNAIITTCSMEEAKYLLEHFIQISISRGMALSQKDHEVKELQAQLHQTELNNTLQQDLLKHMINDRVDIEVDNLMTNAVDGEMDSSTSSSSSSPADSMFESQVPPEPAQLPIGLFLNEQQQEIRKKKVRRKTATPEELLYADPQELGVSTLHTLPETPEEEKLGSSGGPSTRNDAPAVNGISDSHLMPPPRLSKVPSAANLPRLIGGKPEPGPSPSFRRKEFPKPSPEPSPILRRKNTASSLSRSSSVRWSSVVKRPSLEIPFVKERPKSAEFFLAKHSQSHRDTTSSDTTPPNSPPSARRSRDGNVFSRLTSNTQPPLLNPPNRGNIVPTSAKPGVTSRLAPVSCTHTAEGHSKAVLSVDATEELLFTSSKDRTAKVWDLHTGMELLSLTGHPNNVVVVKHCPQLQLVFTVSQSYIKVWDIRQKSNNCVKTLSSSGLTDDGPVNFASSRQIDLPPGEYHINDIALNKDGTALYSASGSVVRVWDLKSFSAIGKLNGGQQATVMTLAVDRRVCNDVVITGSKDHYVKVFEVLEERAGIMTPKHNLAPPHYDGIQSLAIQGNTLFSGSRDTCIKKWDLDTQQLIQSVNQAHKDWICALDFMPSSNILLSGCRGGFLKLWNVENCQPLGEIKAHPAMINSIATNSNSIFTASNEPVVKMWQYRRTQTLITQWEYGNSNQVAVNPVNLQHRKVWQRTPSIDEKIGSISGRYHGNKRSGLYTNNKYSRLISKVRTKSSVDRNCDENDKVTRVWNSFRDSKPPTCQATYSSTCTERDVSSVIKWK